MTIRGNKEADFSAWDEDNGEDGAKLYGEWEPHIIAESYAEYRHQRMGESPEGMTVCVRNWATNEVTRWVIVVEYVPTYYANPKT